MLGKWPGGRRAPRAAPEAGSEYQTVESGNKSGVE